MKTSEALREIMKSQNVGVSKLSDRLGKKPNVISERLGQENISISKLEEMLKVLDCKLVIVPRDVSTPKGGYEIG